MNLRQNMQEAWLRRRAEAERKLRAAHKAPALFKSETVVQWAADYRRADAEVSRWSA